MTELLVLPFSAIPGGYKQNFLYGSNINTSNLKLRNISSQKKISSFPTSLRRSESEELPKNFAPGPFDVICSQGKTAKSHPGNVYFQSIIRRWAKEYANTIEKRNKSKIVRNIIETIQEKSRDGGFIRKGESGGWCVVVLDQAREKVSQSLRDTLAGHYRSSLTAKKRSRTESNLKRMIDFEEVVGANRFVCERISWLSETIKTNNDSSSKSSLDDSDILKLMNDTNHCILQQLKDDQKVQQKVQNAPPQQNQGQFNMIMTTSCEGVDETLKKFHTDKGFLLLQEPSSKRCKK